MSSGQTIVKRLQLLEAASLVRHERHGREVLDASRFEEARAFLDAISAGWDRARPPQAARRDDVKPPADPAKRSKSNSVTMGSTLKGPPASSCFRTKSPAWRRRPSISASCYSRKPALNGSIFVVRTRISLPCIECCSGHGPMISGHGRARRKPVRSAPASAPLPVNRPQPLHPSAAPPDCRRTSPPD